MRTPSRRPGVPELTLILGTNRAVGHLGGMGYRNGQSKNRTAGALSGAEVPDG
jgi:hypothetical protein